MDDPNVKDRRFLVLKIRNQMEQITSATSKFNFQFDIQSKISTIQDFLTKLEDLTRQLIGSSGEQEAMDEFFRLEADFDEVKQNFYDMQRAETTNPTVHNQGETQLTKHPMSFHGSSHQGQGLSERSEVSDYPMTPNLLQKPIKPLAQYIASHNDHKGVVPEEKVPGEKQSYLLQPEEIDSDIGKRIAKYRIVSNDTSHLTKMNKVIIVGGEMGAGKSTTINCIINYLFGVELSDPFRLKLISEKAELAKRGSTNQSTSQSMTTWVSAYEIQWREGFRVNFNVTVVDVPGFNDTGGRDNQIVKQIKDYLNQIEELSALAFVVKASDTRLSESMMKVYTDVLSMYAKDVKEAAFLFFTFSTLEDPQALENIKADNLGFLLQKFFKLNNEVLYLDKDKYSSFFWETNEESLADFFKKIEGVSVSLEDTKDLHKAEEKLQLNKSRMQGEIRKILKKIDEVGQDLNIFKVLAGHSEPQSYRATVTTFKDIEVKTQYMNLNCTACNVTCHENCSHDASSCEVIKKRLGFLWRYCTKCRSNCGPDSHTKERKMTKLVRVPEEKTIEHLKAKYSKDKLETISVTELATNALFVFTEDKKKMLLLFDDTIGAVKKIESKALRNKCPPITDFLQNMIDEEEKLSKKPGVEVNNNDLIQMCKDLKKAVDETMSNGGSIKERVKKFEIETQMKTFLFSEGAQVPHGL